MDKKLLEELKTKAYEMRCLDIKELASFGNGHIGGAMSICDLLAYLYFKEMNVDPKNPKAEDRDRLVLSKGHCGSALYAALAMKGFFPEDWLYTINIGGTKLPFHCDMLTTPGIDFSTGSLGQGFSVATGIAVGLKLKKSPAYSYAILGDGESQEGQIWEAAEFAGAQKLDHLIGFTDCNGQQLDSYTQDIIPVVAEDLAKRYETFGWDAYVVDGHDIEAIDNAVQQAKKTAGKPHMIVMKTQKCKGFIPGEGIKANHSMNFNPEQAEEAIKALKEREGR